MMRLAALLVGLLALAGPLQAQTLSPYAAAAAVGTARTFVVKGVDLHTATGDVGTIAVPTSITKYQITAINITNCSTAPLLAQVGVYTGAGATGTTLVTAAVITGATGPTVVLNSTLAGTVATSSLTAATLYVNLGVANVAALTCDVYVSVRDLS